MPGLAMDPSQVSLAAPHRSPTSPSVNDVCEKDPHVKDEYDASGEHSHDEATYKPRPQLPKPFVFMRSLADLIKDLDNDIIDVDPEYQREVVWTADRMTGLVDSLMENFYIPPIILNKRIPADKSKPAVHVCVDGKQRLSSVRAFVKGMIPCHDFRGEKWWFCDTPGSRRKKVLPEETQKTFLRKEFVSFEFKELLPDQEEDLFARVQMGVQLSLAEKMRASTGPWQELARLFVDDFPDIYSLMKDRARAKDFQLTLSCFSQIVEVMHPTASDGIPILRTNYNALPKLLSNKAAVDDALKSHLASVWNIFKELIDMDPDTFTNASKWLRGVQTFAPVEMVAVAVLISMYSDTRNKRLLLGDIRALREAIRENFNDIRMNTKEWSFIWKYIEELEAIRGAVDGSTVQRRVATIDTNVSRTNLPAATQAIGAEQRATSAGAIKALPALPHRGSFIIKKERDLPSASTVESRQTKRQRTDPGPINPRTSIVKHTRPLFASTTHAAEMQPSQLGAQLAQYAYGQPQYPPVPMYVPTPPTAIRSFATLSPQIETGSNQSTYNSPYGYRAPTALVAPPVPIAPMHRSPIAPSLNIRPPLTTSSTSPLISGSRSHTPVKNAATLKTGYGAYSSKIAEEQWAGEIRSASPTPDPVSTLSSKRRRSEGTPRDGPPQPNIAQYDGAIDLTSDSEQEQERQNLLLTFKAKAIADRKKQLQQNAASSPSRPESS
ncbi:hypothetical protein HBI54_046160 [Parastagonospora nodorum]|nr:hypothetical protein HBI54_046160 [Parastagonospora nodorum]